MPRVLLPSVQGGRTSTTEGSISGGDSTPTSKAASTQTSPPICGVAVQCTATDGLQSSLIALAASLRTVNEHLHERFLIAILIIVQQPEAHRGSLLLCHQLVASSLDQVAAQHASNHSSMAATRQPMVHRRCSTIHGLRPKLLSEPERVRSVSGATSITRHTSSGPSHLSPRGMSTYEIALSFASTALPPKCQSMALRGSFNCPPRGSLSTRSPPWVVTMSSTTWSS